MRYERGWGQRIADALLSILAVAVAVRVAWTLLEPAIPLLVAAALGLGLLSWLLRPRNRW